MKLVYLFCLIFTISCKKNNEKNTLLSITNNNKNQNDSVYFFKPHYAIYKPVYSDKYLVDEFINDKCDLLRKKLIDDKGSFLGDTDENDIYGHPDTDYDGLSIWYNSNSNRKEIYFDAKKIKKEYYFFIENKTPILILEGKFSDDGFVGDSIFCNQKSILLWKNSMKKYVTNEKDFKGKKDYLKRVLKEIKQIEGKNQEVIENYKILSDTTSSFVIANLKSN